MEHLELSAALEKHVRDGDAIHLVLGHSRWTAAARELARLRWGTDPGFTLHMLSLGSLGALWFRGGLVRKVVTTYSGDPFPTYTPNPVFQHAYRAGEVEVEHWSILTFQQRLEAAARGLPAMVTGSLVGSSMAGNDDFATVDTPFGSVGLVSPLVPDVALLHAPVADRAGNVAITGPLMEGLWGCWAARRGAIVTVDEVVDDLSPWAHLVQLPAHRVLAVCRVPFGAHPGGMFARGLPVDSYGEDIPFWSACRAATRGDFDEWARQWCLDVPTQEEYLRRLGPDRLEWLKGRTDPESWRADETAHPVDAEAPVTAWETAAALAARELVTRIDACGADAVLAGAGVANLAAWVGVARARAAGSDVKLTAELGLWDYTPTPADPYIFNHRVFPASAMLADASRVLGMVIGGPGTATIGCLGAAQIDRFGNINSTDIPGGPFLVGSGGGADVAARAVECLVVTLARPNKLPAECGYVTSPGRTVRTVVTDLGILRKPEGSDELRLAAVPAGDEPLEARVKRLREACGWDLDVVRDVEELATVTLDEAVALRRYDPERLFLGD